MESKIDLSDIYDKNINFIFGSGASVGLFPTLKVALKGNDNSEQTIESLAEYFENKNDIHRKTLLFMYYYKTCVEPILRFDFLKVESYPKGKEVVDNYKKFISTILTVIKKKKNNDHKACNLFTTNYDECIVHAADDITKSETEEFVLNDGARGFFRRYLSAKNYNSYVKQAGVFDRYSTQLTQINLIPLHGSRSWIKDNDVIRVDYSERVNLADACAETISDISVLSKCLNDSNMKLSDLESLECFDIQIDKFWNEYNKLPIVNPTKWKFYETVFEEHYYQMLRYLSYELERPNSILVTFGFSFADEHILNLVKRSLTNPSLQIFVSCFNEDEYISMSDKFKKFKNVTLLKSDSFLDFSKFNSSFFSLDDQNNLTKGILV